MLNQETKRKIDSCRDILVGKLPDPKAQIEQITNALIYKFMADMDKASVELGGKAGFFINGYEQYAWDKLMSPKLGGSERMALYSDALGKLSMNPHLPQLFRDIFKDAFLPYRDAETLNMLLKEIDWFTYSHSEDLGDAFEYLLSIMGSQGDAGQFRTPRHIIDFIVAAIDPKKEETILDPACGTAGFLISSYKHILQQNTDKKPGDKLTPDEKTALMNQIVGYDISPDMVRFSLVNMYLHVFPDPHIHEYDTLSYEERWDDNFDVIMNNNIDGLIINSPIVNDNFYEMIRQFDRPCVLLQFYDESLKTDFIHTDDFMAAYEDSLYLIGLNHRHIACIGAHTYPQSMAYFRKLGYEKALADSGIPVIPDYYSESNFSMEDGYQIFKKFRSLPVPPTAMISYSDQLALGAMRAAVDMGLSIPKDVSIIGYDDINLASYVVPRLTTVFQEKTKLGQMAFERILNRISDPTLPVERKILQSSLVIRESCEPAPV